MTRLRAVLRNSWSLWGTRNNEHHRQVMKSVLLPVKDFRNAKQRLAPALDSTTRKGLARAMLGDVLDALSRTRAVEQVVVVSACDEVIRMAKSFGFEIIIEKSVDGHSAAVNRTVEMMAPTCSRILAVAGDLPCLLPSEVDFVLEAVSEPITFIPSRDWTGTNGVVFMPPARILMEYGSFSFRRHVSKAAAA